MSSVDVAAGLGLVSGAFSRFSDARAVKRTRRVATTFPAASAAGDTSTT